MTSPRSILPARAQASGFSLIELLATIGIIAALAALIFPSLKSAIGHRDSTVCLSNLRQAYLTYLNEMQDNNMTLPLSITYASDGTSQGWPDKVYNSLGGDFQTADGGAHGASFLGCPAERRKLKMGANRRTFGINAALTDSSLSPTDPNYAASVVRNFNSFAKPSKTALLADGPLKSATSTSSSFNNSASKLPDAVHAGYANMLFLDGHAAPMSSQALSAMVGSASGNGSDISVFWIGH